VTDPSKKSISMIRSFVLADFITLAKRRLRDGRDLSVCLIMLPIPVPLTSGPVFILLPLALVCDVLDGFVAHRLKRQSLLGPISIPLADIVSFGVAPAILGFALGLQGMWDALVLIYFVGCGISRLARFNATAEALPTEQER